jgi:hypothetical protein
MSVVRVAGVLAIGAIGAIGCYTPSLHEGVACTTDNRCPQGQSCDVVFHECASAPICTPPAISDTFDGMDPCGAWGRTFNAVDITMHDGVMSLRPQPMSGGGCSADDTIPFERQGVFLEVSHAPSNGEFALNLNTSIVTLGVVGGQMLVLDGATASGTGFTVPYRAEDMRWWRVRPVDTGVLGEVSPDGVVWTEIGILDITIPSDVSIELTTSTMATDPDAADLASLGVCPTNSHPP